MGIKILIGVDGSAGGFAAVSAAGRIASAQDELTLYYAPPHLGVVSGRNPDPAIMQRVEKALSDAVFDEARKRLPASLAASANTQLGSHAAKFGLLAAGHELRADLIVVGAHGTGAGDHAVLGSVARYVVHQARIPVLVARPCAELAEAPRVLLAYDGSESSRQAAAVVQKIHWPAATVGMVITVIESMFAGHVPEWLEQMARDSDTEAMAQAWVREHDEERRQALDALRDYAKKLPPAFHGSEPIVAEGVPSEQILRVVRAQKISMVVIGERGRGLVARLLLGSTSEKIVSTSPCSVLVVRQSDTP